MACQEEAEGVYSPCLLVVGLSIAVSAGHGILVDLRSKFRPIEMFLQHCHFLLDAEVS
jgi:hypothetical protein